jgi:hypothetical protein
MAEQRRGDGFDEAERDTPRPHGDPLKGEIVEPNAAQRQSDSAEDGINSVGREEPTQGTRSTSNGINGWDEDGGEQRRRQYDNGAEIVSKID